MVKETFVITGQHLTNALLDNGEKPSVISAVLKQQATERARKVINLEKKDRWSGYLG